MMYDYGQNAPSSLTGTSFFYTSQGLVFSRLMALEILGCSQLREWVSVYWYFLKFILKAFTVARRSLTS